MTDSLKLHSVASESENCTYPVGLAECMQDEPCSHAHCGDMNCSEGSPSSNGIANAQALHSTHPVQDLSRLNFQSMPELASSPINTAGSDSCRPPDFYPCSSACSLHNHMEDHSLVWSLASPSTSTHAHVPLAHSSADHLPSPYDTLPPESIPPSFSLLGRHHGLPAPIVRQLPPTRGSQDSFLSISEQLIRNPHPIFSPVPRLATTHDRLPYSEQDHSHVSTRDSTSTLHTEIGHWVSVPSNPVNITERGSISEPEYLSGSRHRVHRVRRSPHVREHTRQGSLGTEGTSQIRTQTRSVSISPILRPYCISAVSQTPSSSDVGESFEDCDELPPLLSPSDSTESDRPPSPNTSRNINTDSQMVSDEGRSRFLNPGTPIQTELPELQSILELLQTEGHSHRLWVVPETNISPDQADFQMSSEDDDIAGDIQRANELLSGLEQVNSLLVKRYEKVRGYGNDICTVCRDALLPPEDKDSEDVEQRHEPVEAWNIFTSTTPLIKSPPLEPGIHAFPCCHLFHTDCLIPWLSLKTTCPTCRLDIDPHSLTLRVRGWASSRWPHIEHQERQYVNVDVLGRRIPWRRPPAESLEEWVERKENETPEEREKRLKFRPSLRRHSEPPEGLESAHHSRRRTLSDPPTTDPCRNSHTTPSNLATCESPEEFESPTGYFGPHVRLYSLGGPRWSVPDEETRYTADRMLLGLSPHRSPSPSGVGLEEPLYRHLPQSIDTSPPAIASTTVLQTRSSAIAVMPLEPEMTMAEHSGLSHLCTYHPERLSGTFQSLNRKFRNIFTGHTEPRVLRDHIPEIHLLPAIDSHNSVSGASAKLRT